VTLLREGQPVRMSKRRGEFVLMEELLEEVGRDAARFTFLMRRHDSPLEFDLAFAVRHRRTILSSTSSTAMRESRVSSGTRARRADMPPWTEVDFSPLTLLEEQALIKRLLQFPDLVAGGASLSRIGSLPDRAGGRVHPYYKAHQ
jgi:arginyl-tRNA synthetase